MQPINNLNASRTWAVSAKLMWLGMRIRRVRSGYGADAHRDGPWCACRERIDYSKRSCAIRRGERRSPRALNHARSLVFVVVLVPIALGVPAMPVFIPPPVVGFPAAVALRREFAAPVCGFLAVRTVMRNGVVQVMVNFLGSALAVVGADRRGRKRQESGDGGRRHRYVCGVPNLCTILHGRCFLLMG